MKHKIRLGQEEIVRTKPYQIPFALRESVNQNIEEMLRLDVIEPSESSFCNPMVVVKKPDNSNRICLDFRKLNNITVFDGEPMSDTEEIFSCLAKSTYFTKIDLTKGYWQIPLEEESKEYTAFPTDLGLFQFKVLAFGLMNAPACFNKLMRKLLKGMKNVKHFLDDILVYTNSWQEHVSVLNEVLLRLQEAGLTARPSKCNIGISSVDYLGHTISKDVVMPGDATVVKILSASAPTTKKELRSSLGLVGYFRKFLPQYASLVAPLTDLTKKNCPNKLEWKEEHEEIFVYLKKMLTSDPVLQLPDMNREFILCTDASNAGLGAVLLQEHDGIKKTIAYASKRLLPREHRYSTIEREAMAMVWGVKKFSPYIYGKQFILETDHKPLGFLYSAKNLNSRITRWALSLQPYFPKIRVIKGTENIGADYLSRVNNYEN